MFRAISRSDLGAAGFLLALVVIFFWPVLFGGKTLVPADNLFAFPPWSAFAQQLGVPPPHNPLLSDLLLENYVWKHFIVDSLRAGELPLWNPYLFGGVPFLAAGQHSALYPLSVLFLILPITLAYGYFIALHLFLGGLFTYVYLRMLGATWFGGLIAAVTFAFSLFVIVNIVFPMVIAAIVWLPLLLAIIEGLVRQVEGAPSPPIPLSQGRGGRTREGWGTPPDPRQRGYAPLGTPGLADALWRRRLPLLLAGTLVVGIQFLAGHFEFSLYVLLTAGLYSLARLWLLSRRLGLRAALGLAAQLLAMVAIGTALAGVQLVPFYELAQRNFRQGLVSYQDVISWAYPLRQLVTFLLPDAYGNPTHQSYFDLFTWRMETVQNDFGFVWVPPKNYVEAGTYVGLLPLLLAGAALLRHRNFHTWFFAGLAAISLLFTFGTPLYAVLYYLVPGWNQLHTPFRWVFPYTLSIAILAGLGASWLSRNPATIPHWVFRLPTVLGITTLVSLGLSFVWRSRIAELGSELVARSASIRSGFSSGQVLFSYEFRNILLFGLFLTLTGLVIFLARRGWHLWQPFALVLVAADLFTFGIGFNPAANPDWLKFTPPAIQFLQNDRDLYRVTTFGPEKTLNPNAPMPYGISDVRGYDTMIPRQYVQYMELIEPQGQLLNNRISQLFDPASLDSPLLALANVKYVATTEAIDRPGYRLVYDSEVRIYLNENYLPRAFLVPRAIVAEDEQETARLLKTPSFDPRQEVVLDRQWTESIPAITQPWAGQVEITYYTGREVSIDVNAPQGGFLVLADSYFPGWQARVDGREVEILRANLNFRAVALEPGQHTVVLRYSPTSLLIGLGLTGLALALLVLGFVFWLWQLLYYRDERAQPAVQRVAKNTLAPTIATMINRLLDLGFALVMFRVLGPTGVGKFSLAIIIVLYVEIATNFGLNTLLTREVAKDPTQGSRYLSNTIAVRLFFTLLAAPLLALFVAAWHGLFDLGLDTVAAIGLLAVAMIPSHVANALSGLFYAHERMEHPALATVLTTVMKVAFGLLALAMGWGFVGLAGVSIVVNIITVIVLYRLMHATLPHPRWEFSLPESRAMLPVAFPLMLNSLLSSLFFRIDNLILQPIQGATVLGWYATAYKFVDALNIIPSSLTLALFPLFSRYAASAPDSLQRAYTLALKYLLVVSFPIAFLIAALAEPLVAIVAGPAYLPHSAIALQVLIWFLPFSFANSVTQYVLIALNEQRFATLAFLIALPFNVAANLLLIPIWSYVGAALVTILSEAVLMIPFLWRLRAHLPLAPILTSALRPVVAALAMVIAGLGLWPLGPAAAIALALLAYAAMLLALGTFTAEDRSLARRLVGMKA